jgi:hypothetical protein
MPRARGGVRLGFDHPAFVDEMGDDGALDVASQNHSDTGTVWLSACARFPEARPHRRRKWETGGRQRTARCGSFTLGAAG